MGWTGEEIRALNEKRKAKLEARAKEQQARQEQEQQPVDLSLTEEERQQIYEEEQAKREQPKPASFILTEEQRQQIYEEEKAKREHSGEVSAVQPQATLQQPLELKQVVGAIFLVLILLGWLSGRSPAKTEAPKVQLTPQQVEQAAAQRKEAEAKREAERKAEEARCRTDLQCWADKQLVNATVACRPAIERLAKHQAEWTDTGWGDQKFVRFAWKDQPRGIISYFGDKIKFQNGFGAWTPHVYQCDFDTQTEKVLSARAEAGRLPEE